MKSSTVVMIFASAVAQPIIWIKHPSMVLGATVFLSLASVMCAAFLLGIGLWIKETLEDR